MIVVLGSVVAAAGKLAEALALSQAHVSRSRLEPGCIAHAVYQDPENAQRLVFVEQWLDAAALAKHFNLSESHAFVKALSGLLSERPSMALFEASPFTLPA